jgi:hypothetical protein
VQVWQPVGVDTPVDGLDAAFVSAASTSLRLSTRSSQLAVARHTQSAVISTLARKERARSISAF